MRKAIILLISAIAILMSNALAAKMERNFAVGQVWTYKTRIQDNGSLIKINKIENDGPLGRVFHISMTGVRLGQNNEIGPLGHLPVSAKTLEISVIKQVKSDAKFPDSTEGIAEWRAAKGGVFTISIAEIAEIIDQSTKRNEIEPDDLQPATT